MMASILGPLRALHSHLKISAVVTKAKSHKPFSYKSSGRTQPDNPYFKENLAKTKNHYIHVPFIHPILPCPALASPNRTHRETQPTSPGSTTLYNSPTAQPVYQPFIIFSCVRFFCLKTIVQSVQIPCLAKFGESHLASKSMVERKKKSITEKTTDQKTKNQTPLVTPSECS